MEIATIGVVGSGQMGNGIAQVAACSGFGVTMVDVEQEYIDRGMESIRDSLERLVRKGRMTEEESGATQSRISTSIGLDPLSGCDLVVEAIPEIPELKFSTFSKLDAICKPESILASRRSSASTVTSRVQRTISPFVASTTPPFVRHNWSALSDCGGNATMEGLGPNSQP